MRVLVCGGRDYNNYEMLSAKLDYENETNNISIVIHGAAKGADLLAEKWAKERQIPYCGIPAKWNEHGKSAGPIRNQWMLEHAHPHKVIAFPGGRGTADMVERAEKANIQVTKIGWL